VGTNERVTRSIDVDEQREEHVAEEPRGSEEELARGRVEQTPVTMINWVAVAIGAFAAIVIAIAVVAYLLA
jgi:hypothetical protein